MALQNLQFKTSAATGNTYKPSTGSQLANLVMNGLKVAGQVGTQMAAMDEEDSRFAYNDLGIKIKQQENDSNYANLTSAEQLEINNTFKKDNQEVYDSLTPTYQQKADMLYEQRRTVQVGTQHKENLVAADEFANAYVGSVDKNTAMTDIEGVVGDIQKINPKFTKPIMLKKIFDF